MIRGPLDSEDPDRLYTVTGGRSRADESVFDMVTLIVSESEPSLGMQSEHVKILRMCRRPMAVVEISSYLGMPVSVVKILLCDLLDMAVVEISSYLGMPVSVVKILLCDLLDTGKITARHPHAARPDNGGLPEPETLKKVLVALQNL